MKPTLVVLAAGIGSRYGGLKQIDPVGPSGEIVIDYSIYDALRAGFGRVVFVIRREIEADFRAKIGAHLEGRIPVAYVYQDLADLPPGYSVPGDRKKPWGTGHAIRSCRDAVHEPFAVINADDFYGRESYRFLGQFLGGVAAADARYAMVGFRLRNTLSEHGHVARGICAADAGGFLQGVVERTKIEQTPAGARFATADGGWAPLTGSEIASMNMWGFTPTLFGHLEREFRSFLDRSAGDAKAEFFIPTVVDNLIRGRQATVRVLETPEIWFGVTYPADKPVVVDGIRARIAAGTYPERLWHP